MRQFIKILMWRGWCRRIWLLRHPMREICREKLATLIGKNRLLKFSTTIMIIFGFREEVWWGEKSSFEMCKIRGEFENVDIMAMRGCLGFETIWIKFFYLIFCFIVTVLLSQIFKLYVAKILLQPTSTPTTTVCRH
jgi:hypothetical protein